jgi:signal transduction histidine kinase
MKSKLSITKKLFFITGIFFAIFIGSTLIVQSIFFERFYIDKKREDLSSSLIAFTKDYNKTKDDAEASEVISKYEEDYNVKVMMLDSLNRLIFNTSRERSDGPKVKELSDFIRRWNEDAENKVELVNRPEAITYLHNSREGSGKNVFAAVYNEKAEEIIFAFSSLQPVNEAVSVIEGLYLYFGMAAMVFTIIMALIYSKIIAKPLVKIKGAAEKMASFDFSEKCEVTSGDEIGSVAATLNFLSENLDNAMTSLKQANARLYQDIEKERRLEKMRKEFIAAVSHELKTPISLIDGYAVGLKDDIFEGEDKDYYLDVIIDEAEKMGNLVNDMLDLSYLESGSFKLCRQEFNMTELIKLTLKKYEALISDKRAELNLVLQEEIKAFADWTRMEQVLTNFITNAIRHVSENGVISISSVDKGDKISIEIENTGSTIPEEELSRLWDKFYKIDKSRNRKLGGTGIGLSIVKNILVHHGYGYGAENTDRGVRFYFCLPKL